MSVYIDDFLFASNIINVQQILKNMLISKYQVKNLSKIKTIIEYQITRYIIVYTRKINQSTFIRDLVIDKGLIKKNINVISMKSGLAIKIFKSKNYDKTDFNKYQYLIGKLIYLAYETRLDIVFIQTQLNKHNADPIKDYLRVARRIVRYLKETMQMELIYRRENLLSKNPPLFSLKKYIDNNIVYNPGDNKLVISYCFFLNDVIILQYNKNQRTISRSIMEAKYIILGHSARKVV